jgi:hypothetical protein
MTIRDYKLNVEYRAVTKFIIDMMSAMKNKRFTCDQILNDKKFWALNISDIENDVNCKELSLLSINKISIEQNFCNYFVKIKLMNK